MLAFTTEEHGFRLQTLLNKIDELEYSILIVKTTGGEVSFSDEKGEVMCCWWVDLRWILCGFMVGTTSTNIFWFRRILSIHSFSPSKEIPLGWTIIQRDCHSSKSSETWNVSLCQQRKTRHRRRVTITKSRPNFSPTFVFFRNGDGLCIDQSLCEGRTARCETFDNEPLCSHPDFSISILEMIAFDFSSS